MPWLGGTGTCHPLGAACIGIGEGFLERRRLEGEPFWSCLDRFDSGFCENLQCSECLTQYSVHQLQLQHVTFHLFFTCTIPIRLHLSVMPCMHQLDSTPIIRVKAGFLVGGSNATALSLQLRTKKFHPRAFSSVGCALPRSDHFSHPAKTKAR